MAAVLSSRSDSLSRRRAALTICVSPSASAATTLSTGIRSGMGAASIVTPRSAPRRTVTASCVSRTSAPKRRRTSSTARSPCDEATDRPVTVTPAGESAPMHRKNAAFDQSPSTWHCAGRRAVWPPGMVYVRPLFCRRMPDRRSASSVMAM